MRLSVKERREKFVLLLLLTLAVGGLFGWVLFSGYGTDTSALKAKLTQRIREEELFRAALGEARPAVDSVYRKIQQYDPGVQAVFLESDIRNQVGAINALYQRRAYDPRYKCFWQQAQFLEMLFNDRKELRGNYKDMETLGQSLDDCKLSRRGLQEALMNQGRRGR
ncbi:type VI secretion system TssO [Dinghuibacter silviterrae]|uniref:Uncharacterized protein n=1 Tax=Dinghuibacter silviterrae TaxID=1539049 RepID=A0A4R8DHS0_9BACT|nr:type VI secretion system TssO [Dinghuibacter silviterrae]TDW96804.1 hypothetical protein EDB95_4640 [Dinghuibacter silviterrae]